MQEEQNQKPTKGGMKVYCVICGKPPESPTTCPNCGITNICSYHIYKFVSGTDNSPMGCPKCGPRCSMCGSQTTLVNHMGRRVCSKCVGIVRSAEEFKKNEQAKTVTKIKSFLAGLFPFIGLGVGIYFGVKPEYQKIITDLLKSTLPKEVLIGLWAVAGLVAGSFVASIFNSMAK